MRRLAVCHWIAVRMANRKKRVLSAVMIGGVGAAYLLWPSRSFKMPSQAHLQAAFPRDSRQILEESQQFTLISIKPSIGYDKPKAPDYWHGFQVLGQTVITNPQEKTHLIAALYDSMAREDGAAACFNPRHGIRAVRDGKTVDFSDLLFVRQHASLYTFWRRARWRSQALPKVL